MFEQIPPSEPTETESRASQLLQHDQQLISRFQNILKRMTTAQVRDRMGVDPQAQDENLWRFQLESGIR